MVRTRKLVPKRGEPSSIIYRARKISERSLNARRRELLKAGYLESVTIYGKHYNEISRLDNRYEAGLLSLTVKELRRTGILRGRRNHIKKIMEAEPGMSYKEAQIRAVREIKEQGGTPGVVDDYIEYYY